MTVPVTSALPTLSPSRAADFKTCPLLYRFRSIDRLPERPTPDQARGTLVHAVLEALFDAPAGERTLDRAASLVAPQWQRLIEEEPELATIFAADPPALATDEAGASREPSGAGLPLPRDGEAQPARLEGEHAAAHEPGGADLLLAPDGGAQPALPERAAVGAQGGAGGRLDRDRFLAGARELLQGYFAVEDPNRLEPADREVYVEAEVDGRLVIRGIIDRLDVSPAGDLRVVDYKTGGAPREAFEARAMFQLKFYALVLWKTRGVVPRVLRLMYLRDQEVCDFAPDADDLERFERTLLALWQAIELATRTQDFRPKPSRLCGWCAHQALCPSYGGTPPAFPAGSSVAEEVVVERD